MLYIYIYMYMMQPYQLNTYYIKIYHISQFFYEWGMLSIAEINVYHIIKKYHTQWHNLKLNGVLARGQHLSQALTPP